MHRGHLPASLLRHRSSPAREPVSSAVRQTKRRANSGKRKDRQFRGPVRSGLGAPAVLLGKMQIAGNFERHGGLIGKGTGATNIFLRNSGAVQTIEHAKHPQNLPLVPSNGTARNWCTLYLVTRRCWFRECGWLRRSRKLPWRAKRGWRRLREMECLKRFGTPFPRHTELETDRLPAAR